MLTIDLLDTLLCPSGHNSAEEIYNRIPLKQRASSLLSLMLQIRTSTASTNETSVQTQKNSARIMLLCVLLRRDVSSLGLLFNDIDSTSQMLCGMVQPLLEQLFQGSSMTGVSTRDEKNIARLIGFVLAEICSSLSLLDSGVGNSVETVRFITSQMGNACLSGDKTALDLVAHIAQQAPISFCNANTDTSSLVSFIQDIIASNENRMTLQTIQDLIQLVCQIALSFQITADYDKSIGNQNVTIDKKQQIIALLQAQALLEKNTIHKQITSSYLITALGQNCLVPLLNYLSRFVCRKDFKQGYDDDIMKACLQQLSYCALNCPSLLVADLGVFHELTLILLRIANSETIEDCYTKLTALELLVSLMDIPHVKALMNKERQLFTLCLVGNMDNGIQLPGGIVNICSELSAKCVDEDVDAWALEPIALQEDLNFWEADDVALFAESILESCICHNSSLASSVLEILLPIVESYLNTNSSWQQQRAALSIMGCCLNASQVSFAPFIHIATEAALKFATHSCVRLQFQAIQLLGAICQTDIDATSDSSQTNIRDKHGPMILKSFAELVSSNCPKVACNACLGIVSYCRGSGEAIDQSLISPYLNDLLQSLANGPLTLDIEENTLLWIRAIGAIACLADVSGIDFVPYYNIVMPGLMECISYGLVHNQSTNTYIPRVLSSEALQLRGAALEGATIIGKAVEETDLFEADAEKLMSFILILLQNTDECELISQEYLFAASGRIASTIREKFLNHSLSNIVIPLLIKKAKDEVDISITNGNDTGFEAATHTDAEFSEDTGTESVTLSLPGVGVKKLTLNTVQLEEKAIAARTIYEIANSLGSLFQPYVQYSMDAFVPLLRFKYSAEVRSTASQAVSAIFDSSCMDNVDPQLQTVPQMFFPRIVLDLVMQLAIEDGDDMETLISMSDALSSICYAAYVNKRTDNELIARLDVNEARTFITYLVQLVCSCLRRREHFLQTDESASSLSIESEFLTAIVDSIGFTIKSLKTEAVSIFDDILCPTFQPLLKLSRTQDDRARLAAICLFDDCIEHCGKNAACKYGPILAEAVAEGISSNGDIELQDACIYGISQIARNAPKDTFSSVTATLLTQKLIDIAIEGMQRPKSQIENIRTVENSTSALAALCLFKNSPHPTLAQSDRNQLLQIFLSNCPIREDEDEAKFCHEGLCDLVEAGEIDILSNAKVLLEIIGQIGERITNGEDVVSPETYTKLTQILCHIEKQLDPSVAQNLYGTLSQEAHEGISVMFKDFIGA